MSQTSEALFEPCYIHLKGGERAGSLWAYSEAHQTIPGGPSQAETRDWECRAFMPM
jgi:hypothetical protein